MDYKSSWREGVKGLWICDGRFSLSNNRRAYVFKCGDSQRLRKAVASAQLGLNDEDGNLNPFVSVQDLVWQ